MEVCSIMSEQIRKHFPEVDILSIPVADGGEGTVESFLAAMGGKRVSLTAEGPYRENIEAGYGVAGDGTAIIEMASCAGLPLVEGRKDPGKTTTFGVGQMIRHAAEHGCRKIIVGVGGSCTNDAGAGAAAAAGVRFLDRAGREFVPTGETLSQVERIDTSGLCREIRGSEIVTICDIDNPFFGPAGAAYVFGRQKGASEQTIPLLDAGLRRLAAVISADLGVDVSAIPGSGAGGAMGGGMAAFFGSKLQSGIETILNVVRFDEVAGNYDLIVSGEGKIDSQSLRGKVVVGVARHAKKLGVPLIAVVGDIEDPMDRIYDSGVSAVFSINRVAVDFEQASLRSKADLGRTMDNLCRFIRVMEAMRGKR